MKSHAEYLIRNEGSSVRERVKSVWLAVLWENVQLWLEDDHMLITL
jgi:hypothetical protein